MDSFLSLIASVADFFLPIFVFLTMFNVGLTQKPSEILEYLKDWPFYVRMLIANFLLAPLTMFLLLQLFSIEQSLEAGLMIFSLSAGAPFLIKLTQDSEHDVALGASLMIILVLVTSVYMPLVLPVVLPEVTVSALELFFTLVRQLIVPVILGMILVQFVSTFSKTVQPWVAKSGNITLYIVIIGSLLGNIKGVISLFGEGAIFLGIVFILIATVIGYFLGGKNDEQDHLQDVGALGTGQRNTAASMIIASNNFVHIPEVFLIITVANTLGIVMLLVIAKLLSKDNTVEIRNT